jgi:hypothetical protein
MCCACRALSIAVKMVSLGAATTLHQGANNVRPDKPGVVGDQFPHATNARRAGDQLLMRVS